MEETPGVFHPSAMSSPRDRDRLQRYLNAGSTLAEFVVKSTAPTPCEDVNDYRDADAILNERLTRKGFIYAAKNYVIDGVHANISFRVRLKNCV